MARNIELKHIVLILLFPKLIDLTKTHKKKVIIISSVILGCS